ncbi:MAG: hypothetical protein CVU56_23555 [Deltaproteobacteria bacterium HGW-Deltaproteobacteria-14]|nr:MAG: hypothetical protein CVU56_23555 [Deltaproteobacteria bacterium HGW-Deltaproteobacteria-14]
MIAFVSVTILTAPGCSVTAGDTRAEAPPTDERPAARRVASAEPDAKATADECEAAWQNIVSVSLRKVEGDMRSNGADEGLVADTARAVRASFAERGQEFVAGCTDAMPATTAHCIAELASIDGMGACGAAPQ